MEHFQDDFHVNLTGVKVISLCPSASHSQDKEAPTTLLSPLYESAWHRDADSNVPHNVEHAGKALIHILRNAKSGTVWLVENGAQPREVVFPEQ